MKKIFTLLLLTFSFHASASMITIDVSDPLPAVGDTITLELLASDFSATDTFAFFLDFDTSLFAYDAVSLTSDLYSFNPLWYEVNLYDGYMAFSFMDFDAILSTDFVLASFELTAVAAGATDFAFSGVEFYQDGFLPLSVDSSSSASVSVPEPQAWMLLLTGLVLFRKKAQ